MATSYSKKQKESIRKLLSEALMYNNKLNELIARLIALMEE